MQHHSSFDELNLEGSWVTIGSFDGVHRGHQAILTSLVQGAHTAGLPAVVVTFHPHPAVVLKKLQGPYYLTAPEERAELLAELGVDHVVTLPFTLEIAAQTAQQFMENLQRAVRLKMMLVGYDFALGRGREGDIPMLRALGQSMGYRLEVVSPSSVNGQVVSSTRIRQLVYQGQVSEAAGLLGRWYGLRGKIVHGDGRGRTIGLPTANLAVPVERVIPARGVYACLAWIHGELRPAVTNIGVRPTFTANVEIPRVEAHLLDFNEDLYGMEMRLDFVKFLRPEQRFSSSNTLLDQIRQDILHAREVLPYVP